MTGQEPKPHPPTRDTQQENRWTPWRPQLFPESSIPPKRENVPCGSRRMHPSLQEAVSFSRQKYSHYKVALQGCVKLSAGKQTFAACSKYCFKYLNCPAFKKLVGAFILLRAFISCWLYFYHSCFCYVLKMLKDLGYLTPVDVKLQVPFYFKPPAEVVRPVAAPKPKSNPAHKQLSTRWTTCMCL